MKYVEAKFEIQLEGRETNRDYLQLSDGEWLLGEIFPGAGGGKGKNSCVFSAEDPDGEGPGLIVKFCRFPSDVQGPEELQRRRRFEREIAALKRANEAHLGDFIITYYESGETTIAGKKFLFYAMERADYDLTQFLSESLPTLQQRVLLCTSLTRALRMLHNELGIYHRDLKPDNIFFVENQWKIGDLGFVAFRGQDEDLDQPRERIGWTGFMCPEAVNKAFANLAWREFAHEAGIDAVSDIYQLGGIFWYVLQGNLPVGQLAPEDFLLQQRSIFSKVLLPMLQHGKQRRPSLSTIEAALRDLEPEFVL